MPVGSLFIKKIFLIGGKNMKKSTMKVLALIMAVIMIVGTLAVVPFSAISDKHVHTKGTFVETVEPTCLLYGYSVYKCAECGESFLTDITDKTEQHDWQEVGEVPATCDTPGYTAGRKCTICGFVEGCEKVEVAHVRAYKILDLNDCEEGVRYVEYCKVCGEILSEDEYALVEGDEEHVLKADVKVAPTCAAEGVADLYCENCGFVIEDVAVEKLECDDDDLEEKTIPATFAENEKTYKKCKVCGKETDKVETPNTSIAFKLGYNLAEEYDALEYGQSKTYEYTYNGVSGTYTLTKDPCEEKPELVGYAYDLPKGTVINDNGAVLESKKTVMSTDFEDAQEFIEGYSEEDVFYFGYAYYLDIADLYAVYYCETCGKTEKVVLIEKVGEIYDEYKFEFYHVVPIKDDKEGVAEFFRTFAAGYDKIEKACGEKTTEVSRTTFELARGEEENKTILGDGAEHKFVYLCNNEACKGEDEDVYVLTYNSEEIECWVCNNCKHIRLAVCLNEDTSKENGICGYYEGVPAEGAHVRGEDEFTAAATCVAPAYKYNKCTVCGAELKIDGSDFGEIDPDNHDWTINDKTQIITQEQPTCITAGKRIRYCSRFGCSEYIPEEIPALGEDYHTLDKYYAGILLKKDEEGFDAVDATCVKPKTYKFYCTICQKMVFVEDGEVDSTVHGEIITVEAIDITCTANGAYEYKYCADCGAVVEFNGSLDVPEKLNKNDEDFLERITISGDTLIFLPESFEAGQEEYIGWNEVYGGDAKIEYEVINFANGEPMFYRLLAGAGHKMKLDTEGSVEGLDCFKSGTKDLYKCSVCNYVDADKDGSEIPALNHKNKKTQAVKSGDEDLVEELEIKGVTDKKMQSLLSLRANPVKTYPTDNGIAMDFVIEYVPATCDSEGYIIGDYCPDCMGDNKYFDEETNVAGYLLEKKSHCEGDAIRSYDAEEICGAENYSYDIYYCTNCERYVVRNYQAPAHDEHEAEVYTEEEAEEAEEDEEIEAGATKIFEIIIVDEVPYEIVDGKYKIGEVEYTFIDCTDTKYEAKKCVNCGEYFDLVEIAPTAHLTADGEVIDITCEGYNKDQVGFKCKTCGLEVPDVYVEKDENGLDVILYFNAAGKKVAEVKAYQDVEDYYTLGNDKYFAIEHDWAVPQVKCEALNADIVACAACGINIVNTDANKEHHEYHIRNLIGEEYDFEEAVIPFDFDIFAAIPNYYKLFAFDDMTAPTFTADGFGTLTCVKCGEVLELTIPAVNAAAKVELDSEDVVLVGNEVTATLKVSAKDFAFNNLTLEISLGDAEEGMLELVNAEILYAFDAIDDVRASINADGNVVIRTPGIANRNVTITGEDVPFVKLTFKTGDLTDKDEYTYIEGVKVSDIDVVRIDDEGDDIAVVGTFDVDGELADIVVYNPAFGKNGIINYSTVGVLAQIYSTEYAAQYDFNGDGAVDLDDYFAMVDFIDSERSIADFCALIGYDIEAMLDNEIYYDEYSSGTSWTLDPNTGAHDTTQGTEADIANAKVVIRKALKDTSYYDIAGVKTIAEFAQSVITVAP